MRSTGELGHWQNCRGGACSVASSEKSARMCEGIQALLGVAAGRQEELVGPGQNFKQRPVQEASNPLGGGAANSQLLDYKASCS